MLPAHSANAAYSSHSRVRPELANAARFDPIRFYQLVRQFRQIQADAEVESQRQMEQLKAGTIDDEVRRKIEEKVRQLAVLENLEYALEYTPESFDIIAML